MWKFVQLTSQFIEFLNQTLPRLLDAASLENVHAKIVSCGARHSAIISGLWVMLAKVSISAFFTLS